MDRDDELAAWERRLLAAEAELREREQRALASTPKRHELRALAAERDKIAADRDVLAEQHDERGVARDRRSIERDSRSLRRDSTARSEHDDADAGFPDRWHSATDRDDAAGDRADAVDHRRRGAEARARAAADRRHAGTDRDAAAESAEQQDRDLVHLRAAMESRLVIGQAQGLLMARYGLSTDTAFAVLVRLSRARSVKLPDVAASVVAEAQPDHD